MWKEKTPKTLSDVYSWLDNGIFKQLEQYNTPWKSYIDGNTLDLDYYGNRSGEKMVSSLIEKLIVDDVLSTANQEKIAKLVWFKYGNQWTKAWEAVIENYDPLNNYIMNKEEIVDETLKTDKSKTTTKNTTEGGTNTKKNTGTVQTQDTETSDSTSGNQYDINTNNDIYGFNSANASNADKSHTVQNNTSTSNSNVDNNSLVTDNRTEVNERNLSSTDNIEDVIDGTDKKASVITTTHKGLSGNATPQSMLEGEVRFRFDYNFFDSIFRDVDKILTTNIFINKETY